MPCERLGVAVVGAGPAGLTAGIHLARAGIDHAVFERDEPGGLLRSAGLVECYPGFPGGIQAPVLVRAMVEQAHELGVVLRRAEVTSLSWNQGIFGIGFGEDSIEASAVILATGTKPHRLNPRWIEASAPKDRIHYVTCTLPQNMERARVWISGGGDAAFDSALQLVVRGASVEIGMRGDRPRALGLLVDRALAAGVRVHPKTTVVRVSDAAPGLDLLINGDVERRVVAQLMYCHGRQPEHTLWHGLASSKARGPHEVESHYPGLFMAGDLVRGECRYVAVAAGDGLRCARLAEAHLERYRGGPP